MATDSILRKILHMRPPCFPVRERQHYRAEKMLMRQFLLMKRQHQVPSYLSAEDMKMWLLSGGGFLEKFPDIARVTKARRLLVAELVEEELREELEMEQRLSLRLGRKVTLEGLQMFLSVILPKAAHDVQCFLRHLSNKLLSFFTGSQTSQRSRLALFTRLLRTTAPLVPQVLETVLGCLLAEVRTSHTQGAIASRDSSSVSAPTDRAEAHTAKQLAEAAATCFYLKTSYSEETLLWICTPLAQDMIRAVHKRFVDNFKTFRLMDFDESFIIARKGVVFAIKDMDKSAEGCTRSPMVKRSHSDVEDNDTESAE